MLNETNYQWSNSVFDKVDPKAAALELERVRCERGALKPADVVEAARSPTCPLHELFPWDDTEAARIGREHIASKIIRAIRVTIETPKGQSIDMRAFSSVRDTSSKGSRSYVATTYALQDDEHRQFLKEQCWKEGIAWRRRNADLAALDAELGEVFRAIDSAVEKRSKAS